MVNIEDDNLRSYSRPDSSKVIYVNYIYKSYLGKRSLRVQYRLTDKNTRVSTKGQNWVKAVSTRLKRRAFADIRKKQN